MNRKVTVVGGAGNVGATVARGVADRQLADVVVIDIADKKAAGVALDMFEACPIWESDSRIMGTGDYSESANSDIVVITSGMPRKPGLSRHDLLHVNYKIMQQVTELVGTSAWYAPGASVVEMVEAILLDKKKILPCSVFLQGEYGVRDLFVGVPCKLGARGLEQVIQITLRPEEDAAFRKSAAAVKELVEVIKV